MSKTKHYKRIARDGDVLKQATVPLANGSTAGIFHSELKRCLPALLSRACCIPVVLFSDGGGC